MSLYYTHLLIPFSPKYRPEPEVVAAFAQGMIKNGNVANPFTISFSRVAKKEPYFREIRNVATGETIKMRLPSRKKEKPEALESTHKIIERASNHREYDVAIVSDGAPLAPPCAVGYVENDTWKPMTEAYHLEICCRVRDHVVRLSMIGGEEELHEPPDFSKWQPTFDEDCSADEREGFFVHPQKEGIRIPNAGSGTFWIEFRYGKFLFPLLRNNSLNLLDDSIVQSARKTFGGDFVQACQWG